MTPIASLYPASPRNVPPTLTAPSVRYRLLVVVVLVSLILFFLFYLGLVAGSAYLTYWSITYALPDRLRWWDILVKVALVAGSGMLFLFLVKGLCKRRKPEKTSYVEIREREHPEFFAFLERLCAETGAPFPHRVYLCPEVNAAVIYDLSLLSLVRPTRKSLLLGLGLVNVLNLSEFKALLAHEFGHFSQSSLKLGGYVYRANRIMADLVCGRDWFDEFLLNAKNLNSWIALPVHLFGAVLWVLRKVLEACFRAINCFHAALSRQMEFNADLMSVRVAGSDATVHALARTDFAYAALAQAFQDLSTAADHHLYTADLFHHQNHAASYLRDVHKDPHLGEPLPQPEEKGERVAVFQPEDDDTPTMWDSHPSDYDREQNAKRVYIPCALDERSPWLLFRDSQAVREQVTRRFYRVVVRIRKEDALTDPEIIQRFIDDEHAETTYHARYHGLYDDRYIEPGEILEVEQIVERQPWENRLLARVQERLYGKELQCRMEEHTRRRVELALLAGIEHGAPELTDESFEFRDRHYEFADVKRLRRKVERELDDDREWLASLDRKVLLVHYQMARQLGSRRLVELTERYRFHLSTQQILRDLSEQQSRLEAVLEFLSNQRELAQESFQGVLTHFREAHQALARSLSSARNLFLPCLKNMPAGEPLNRFLLEKRLIYELREDEQELNSKWIAKFLRQLGEVQDRVKRIHFKSLGGLLHLQEKIARQWRARLGTLPEVAAEPERPAVQPKAASSPRPTPIAATRGQGAVKLPSGEGDSHMIQFTCPHCEKTLRTSASRAGRVVDCPACGEPVTVPDEELEPGPSQVEEAEEVDREERLRRKKRRRRPR